MRGPGWSDFPGLSPVSLLFVSGGTQHAQQERNALANSDKANHDGNDCRQETNNFIQYAI